MIKVIGAGLAGSEAAYYLARRGVEVALFEMKPKRFSPAHESENFCELVCSNSLKSSDVYGNASGFISYTIYAADRREICTLGRKR